MNNKRGFSLIELMIIALFVSAIGAISVPVYCSYKQHKNIASISKKIDIEEIKVNLLKQENVNKKYNTAQDMHNIR